MDDALIKADKDLTWSCDQSIDHRSVFIKFARYSPLGEAFSFAACGNDSKMLVDGVRKYAESFDTEEHALMMKNGNLEGCPDLDAVLEDADMIQDMLDTPANALEKALNSTR